jgi:hypothetical protein
MLKNPISSVKSFAHDHKPELFAATVTIVAGTIGAIWYKDYCETIDKNFAAWQAANPT